MPGSSRLYPETDIPSIEITKKFLDSIEIPELISERSINFEKKYSLSPQYAIEITKQNLPFDYYAEKYEIEPKIIAHALIELPKELKSRFNIKDNPKKEHFEFVFSNLEKKNIKKEAVLEVLRDLLEGKKPDISKYAETSLTELESFIIDLISKNKGAPINGLMGDVMKKYRGSVDGSLAMKLLKKHMK